MSKQEPIPRIFYSEYSEEPFANCIDCESPLFEEESLYTVLKSVVGTETVFEMAICLECAAKLRMQYSEETSQNLQAYMDQKLQQRLIQRLENQFEDETLLLDDDDFSVDEGLAACVFCEKPQRDCHRYEITGMFTNTSILLHSGFGLQFSSPMMLCQECNSDVSKLVSKKTRDSWDRFIETHFDGPPGVEVDGPVMDPILF